MLCVRGRWERGWGRVRPGPARPSLALARPGPGPGPARVRARPSLGPGRSPGLAFASKVLEAVGCLDLLLLRILCPARRVKKNTHTHTHMRGAKEHMSQEQQEAFGTSLASRAIPSTPRNNYMLSHAQRTRTHVPGTPGAAQIVFGFESYTQHAASEKSTRSSHLRRQRTHMCQEHQPLETKIRQCQRW